MMRKEFVENDETFEEVSNINETIMSINRRL